MPKSLGSDCIPGPVPTALIRTFQLQKDSEIPIQRRSKTFYLVSSRKFDQDLELWGKGACQLSKWQWQFRLEKRRNHCNFNSIIFTIWNLYDFGIFFYFNYLTYLKVSKSRKQILKLSFEPKEQRKYFFYFCPSLKKEVKWKK